jgi:hypothetical protein
MQLPRPDVTRHLALDTANKEIYLHSSSTLYLITYNHSLKPELLIQHTFDHQPIDHGQRLPAATRTTTWVLPTELIQQPIQAPTTQPRRRTPIIPTASRSSTNLVRQKTISTRPRIPPTTRPATQHLIRILRLPTSTRASTKPWIKRARTTTLRPLDGRPRQQPPATTSIFQTRRLPDCKCRLG